MAEAKSKLAKLRRFVQFAAMPLFIVNVAVIVAAILYISKGRPEIAERKITGALVSTVVVKAENQEIIVRGNATVRPLQQITVSPEVSGKVVWLSKKMLVGERCTAGEALLKIDERDFKNNVSVARAEVAQAERELALEKANSNIARREWELMKHTMESVEGEPASESDSPNALVLREPQLKSAMARLSAAKASLSQASLQLERTQISAPFNCYVSAKSFDVGQIVRVGESIAELVGTDEVELHVSLSLQELNWVRKSLVANGKVDATVKVTFAGETYRWEAKAIRVFGGIDEASRLGKVVVRVSEPYKTTIERPELAVGTFAEVEISAGELPNVIRIPRSAVRDSETAWVVEGENILGVRKLDILRRDRNFAYVANGLRDGDHLIVSGLSGAVEGMPLRLEGDSSEAERIKVDKVITDE